MKKQKKIKAAIASLALLGCAMQGYAEDNLEYNAVGTGEEMRETADCGKDGKCKDGKCGGCKKKDGKCKGKGSCGNCDSKSNKGSCNGKSNKGSCNGKSSKGSCDSCGGK